MKNLLIKFTSIAALMVLSISQLFAGPPPPPPPPMAIPVNEEAVLILLIGAAIGAKKIYDRRKKLASVEA